MLNKECHRSWWQGNAPVVFSLNTCWDIHVCLRASSRGCRDTVRWLLVHKTYNKDSGQETHLAAVAAVAALLWLWSRLRRKQSLPGAALRRDSLAGCLLNWWSCRSLVLTSPAMRYAVLFSQLYFIRSSNTCCSNGNNHTSHSTPPSVPERFRRRCQKQTWGMRKTARSA